jgi:hypothetical protein
LALAMTLTLLTVGCESPTTSTDAIAATSTTTSTESSDQASMIAKMKVARVVGRHGISLIDMQVSTQTPRSPEADVVLEWETGSAEVDSANGRVYLFSQELPEQQGSAPPLSDELLNLAALNCIGDFGWEPTLLAALGFSFASPPETTSETTGRYTWRQHQYDNDTDTAQDGLIEISLDARTADIASFSFSQGSRGLDLSGVIDGDVATRLAANELGIRTDRGGSQSIDLEVVNDTSIAGGHPVLVWSIEMAGLGLEGPVTGHVLIDAKTGAVLSRLPQ